MNTHTHTHTLKKRNKNWIIHGRLTKNYHVFGAYSIRFIKVTLRVYNLIVRVDAPSAQQTLLIHFHIVCFISYSLSVSLSLAVSFLSNAILFSVSLYFA